MKSFFKYIVSIGILAITTNVNAQDSLKVHVNDTSQLKNKEKHFSVLFGTDYGKLVLTAFNFDSRYEFNLAVQLTNRVRATADYGFGQLAPQNAIENGRYASTGNYYRAGLDYTFEIAPKIFLSFGAMYAYSFFEDEGTIEIKSEIWPSLNESFVRNDLSANWVEFVLTTEAPIFYNNNSFMKNFYWGAKFRLKFLIERSATEKFDIYAIPGFGRTFNDVLPAVNLFVAYKIR